MPNPSGSGITSTTGAWLIPVLSTGATAASSTWVYLNTDSEDSVSPMSAARHQPVSRSTPIIQFSSQHSEEVAISGTLTAATLSGSTVTAAQWETRLRALHRDQGLYDRVSFSSATGRYYRNVFVWEPSVSQTAEQHAAGIKSFSLSITDVS